MADQDATPVADSREWWKMQAERHKAEVVTITEAARTAQSSFADALAAKDVELASAKADIAKALDIAQQSDAAHAETRNSLGAHQEALGQIMGALGPAFSVVAKLLR